MINELAQLADAIESSNLSVKKWHKDYQPIPNISNKAPCIRILIDDGKITGLESVEEETGRVIRKYCDNQSSTPAMNIAPLYRLTKKNKGDKNSDEELIEKAVKPEITDDGIRTVKEKCTVKNWNKKIEKKYKLCISRTEKAKKMSDESDENGDVSLLFSEILKFRDINLLYNELEHVCFEMLNNRKDVDIALKILFYFCDATEDPEKKFGSLSVVFDSNRLELPSIGKKFTEHFNEILLCQNNSSENSDSESGAADAFLNPYVKSDESMPEVKIPGFSVILRTMNTKPAPTLTRYGNGGNDTYPLSVYMRTRLSAALNWIAKDTHESITWIKTGNKDELLFAYPSSLRRDKTVPAISKQFNRSKSIGNEKVYFEKESEDFLKYFSEWKDTEKETFPKSICVFVIRKLNKGCSKVIYDRQATPEAIIESNREWTKAAKNLPNLQFGQPYTPFPLEIAGFLNRDWKMNGDTIQGDLKNIPNCYGMDLFFSQTFEKADIGLKILGKTSGNLASYFGTVLHGNNVKYYNDKHFGDLCNSTVLFGMLLYFRNIRKDDYMHSYAYLLGQLLQTADSLHELYCVKVRSGSMPTQLVGSGLYNAMSEIPATTFSQLGQRLSPYIAWAKTHPNEQVSYGNDAVGPKASTIIWKFSEIMNEMKDIEIKHSRLNDVEKAELFIGYMAKFTKNTEENEKITENKGE